MKLKRKSKYLSLLLRHDPDREQLDMDANGWVPVNQILRALRCSSNDLDIIVTKDEKGRFIYNETKELVRATQGHSIPVDLSLHEIRPPKYLYHGTDINNICSIEKHGIKRMKRNHIHLSKSSDDAFNVGKRHGKPVVFIIDALSMYNDGIKFYRSENNIFLTDYISPQYILNHLNQQD